MSAESTIQHITARLVDGFRPVRVILFGSHARGEGRETSDVDLIVLVESFVDRFRAEAAMLAALRDIRLPIDLLVFTPEEFDRERGRVGSVVGPALREGRVLYERAA